ncbi:MAG: chemotaxis protein CheA [Spirochaetia bacterium]|nr:chemotaxis protein CheA [Spirochaetia bacterium]
MDISKLRETFRIEAADLLRGMESQLLDLEKNPGDLELVDRIFRALHTIKGSGAMFGFDRISQFAHEFESIFDRLRKGQLLASREIVDLTLAGRDHLEELLENETAVPETNTQKIFDAIRSVGGADSTQIKTERSSENAEHGASSAKGMLTHHTLSFRPEKDFFLKGMNVFPLFDELRKLGACTFEPELQAQTLDSFDPEACVTSWMIEIKTEASLETLRDIFIFVEGSAVIEIQKETQKTDKTPVKEIPVPAAQTASTPDSSGKPFVERRKSDTDKEAIRVQSRKIDALLNLAGELVTLKSSIETKAAEKGDADLQHFAEHLDRLSEGLRETAMGMRMIPLDETFQSFSRMVRDLSRELGKEAELKIVGGETEIDKNVIESLRDPLMHIVRNAVDHGLEATAKRISSGKTAKGTVTLSAGYAGAEVLIRVSDDGAGLSPEKILAKAREKGLAREGVQYSEKEIYGFIFLPGFSTAEVATHVSGRGVGMDVVKKNVERLRGGVDIDSEAGRGTTITLRIPLTLAIVDGLLARIGGDHFIFNLSNVEECVDLTPDIVSTSLRGGPFQVRGEWIPHLELRKIFSITEGKADDIERMGVVRHKGNRVGLVVDQVLGKRQTVIKTLGRLYAHVEEVSGATILGDGTVALILDIHNLVDQAIERQAAANGPGRLEEHRPA